MSKHGACRVCGADYRRRVARGGGFVLVCACNGDDALPPDAAPTIAVPPAPPKNKTVTARCDAAELALIRERAKAAGLNVSCFVRRQLGL